ncbi:MAG TPA: cytochrome C, partial [Thermomicrobiales bacterium]|nr:cytochrome C [Thermomicrobiales bacterium]
LAAAALLIGSIALPYWNMTLLAPQYPKGLHVQAYVDKLTGDVFEVDGLNHYIGMMPLNSAASIERGISVFAIVTIAIAALASVALRGGWRIAARIPIVIYPIVFLADLYAWLAYAGHSLNPHAALSSSIKPFTPHMLGPGKIGQFGTDASFGPGFYLAVAAALIVVLATIWSWRSDDAAR